MPGVCNPIRDAGLLVVVGEELVAERAASAMEPNRSAERRAVFEGLNSDSE
jgi:hypothetical protein